MRALIADGKGRMTFAVFVGVVLLAVAGMSMFVFRAFAVGSHAYPIEQGSVFYDSDDAYIEASVPGSARERWDGAWTIDLEDGSSFDLGDDGVVFVPGTDRVSLLGDCWLVATDGGVADCSGLTEIEGATPELYKLADRRYVLVAPQIACEDAGIDTAPYVEVRMDRSGNAWISNHEIHFKTVKPLVLSAGDVRFDIAGERLQTLAEDGSFTFDIDLSRIGGSTNEYTPSESGVDGQVDGDQFSGADGGSGTTVIGGGSASAAGGGGASSSSGVLLGGSGANGQTEGEPGSKPDSDGEGGKPGGKPSENPNAGVMPQLTLTGASTNVTSITFDYRVYDPNGAFASTYALVAPIVNGQLGPSQKILLNAGATTKTVFGLSPNSIYRVTLGYTLYKSDPDISAEHTADFINVSTKEMGVSVTIPALSSKSVTARVATSASYPLDSVDLVLYHNGTEVARQQVDCSKASSTGGWSTTFANPGTRSFDLKLENAVYRGERIELYASCSVKNNVTYTTTS